MIVIVHKRCADLKFRKEDKGKKKNYAIIFIIFEKSEDPHQIHSPSYIHNKYLKNIYFK